MSKAMMRLKLRDRGVDDADIDRGLEQAGIDDREALESVIPKKMGKVSGDDPDMKGRQKVVRSLMSAGFRYDDIKDVMGRLLT
jgi:SOS response regulatory protein OraA/RecX